MRIRYADLLPPSAYNLQRDLSPDSDLNDHASTSGLTLPSGASIRREDENLLAACSKPISEAHTRPSQTSILFELPQELQDNIIGNVRRGDLVALSQTCTTLRATTLPFLLRNIVLHTYSPRRELLMQVLEAACLGSKKPMSTANSLHVLGDEIDSKILDRLLPHTCRLQTLIYQYWVDKVDENLDQIDAHRLGRQLIPIQGTLTHLKISYELTHEAVEFSYINIVGSCCLKNFSMLRTLEIPLLVLLGWDPDEAPKLGDILPRNLVTLVIGEDQWDSNWRKWTVTHILFLFLEFFGEGLWQEYMPGLKFLNLNLEWERVRGTRVGPELIGTEILLKRLIEASGLSCGGIRFPSVDYEE